MFANLTNGLDFQAKALLIRADRQRVIASNIANADTPGYASRDLNFRAALGDALDDSNSASRLSVSTSASPSNGSGNARHIPLQSSTSSLGGELNYTSLSQPTMDGNSVDLDQERANFVDNSVRYEATLRFINGTSRTILSAIQGQ
jgi:flagellar basal-body rod protein FlgB